jgi:hypothetical protein
MEARFPFGCKRRLFLMSSPEWKPATDQQRQRHTQLPATDPHAFVCEELEGISLGQIVHGLLDKHVELPEIVEHVHSRIDIDWARCAQPVVAD